MSDYNGWSNYETWAVNLWLSNDEGTQEYWYQRARFWERQDSTSKYWTVEESARFNLADEIKDAVEEMAADLTDTLDLDTPAGMLADLLNAAISEVDWQEIAGTLLSAVTA